MKASDGGPVFIHSNAYMLQIDGILFRAAAVKAAGLSRSEHLYLLDAALEGF